MSRKRYWNRNASGAALSFSIFKICSAITPPPLSQFSGACFPVPVKFSVFRQIPPWNIRVAYSPPFASLSPSHIKRERAGLSTSTYPRCQWASQKCRLIISIRRQTCFWYRSISRKHVHFLFFDCLKMLFLQMFHMIIPYRKKTGIITFRIFRFSSIMCKYHYLQIVAQW